MPKREKPHIDMILSLRESMRRGERTELREHFNLRGARCFTVIPTTDPWSSALDALPISPETGDILILVDEDNQDDIWDVFRLLGSRGSYNHALLNPELLGAGWGRYFAHLAASVGGKSELRWSLERFLAGPGRRDLLG